MGIASSTLIMRNVEEGMPEERLTEIDERFAFFQRWSLEDIREALDQSQAAPGIPLETRSLPSTAARPGIRARRYGGLQHAFPRRPGEPDRSAVPRALAADQLGRETSWADYYRVTYAVEEKRVVREKRRKRGAWHRATHGFAMIADPRAGDALERYRMFLDRVPHAPAEPYEVPGHTDDEDDGEPEPEDLGPEAAAEALALEAAAAAPAPAAGPEEGDLEAAAAPAPAPGAAPETTPEEEVAEAPAPADDDAPRKLPRIWDPSLRSPVFFGYQDTSAREIERAEEAARLEAASKEDAVAAAQREARNGAIAKFKADSASKKFFRDKKLQDLEEKHFKAAKLRKNNHLLSLKACGTVVEKAQFTERYELDEEAAVRACEAEADTLHKHNLKRESFEAQETERLELEALQIDGAESCTAPGGRRLEQQARKDLSERNAKLDAACADLEEAQDTLEQQRLDMAAPGGKDDDDDELRAAAVDAASFVSAMKTRVHECEGAVRVALRDLDDAEKLLERAVHRRRREENILTLFASLGAASQDTSWDPRSKEDPPFTAASTVDLAVGMAIICNDTFVKRVLILLRLFDWSGEGFLEHSELVSALKCAARLLGGLGFLRRPASDVEMEAMAKRALQEQRVPGGSDGLGMTLAEAMDWLVQLAANCVEPKLQCGFNVANSTFLSGLFGVRFEFGELSAYQRQCMPTVRLFELGLLRPADVKYSVAFAANRVRPQLFSEHKLSLHERAFSRGADDPLKADYSRFLPKRAPRSLSNVVPLLHGHLANLTVYELRVAVRAATRLQNTFRGHKSRGNAEHVARVQAFRQAREVATQQARDRVAADFAAKEKLAGLQRHTWDAKVRIFQARKRAEGNTMDRGAALRLMQEEACEAVAKQVGQRFDEMEVERGLVPKSSKRLAPPPPPKNVTSLHNTMTAFAQVISNPFRKEEALEDADIETPRKGDAEEARDAEPSDEAVNADIDAGYGGNVGRYRAAYETRTRRRLEAMVLGSYPSRLHLTAESDAEQAVRRAYAAPDPPGAEFEARLRAVDAVLTILKTEELLLELPSKRLLLRYVEKTLGADGAGLNPGSGENHVFGGAFGAPDGDHQRHAHVGLLEKSPTSGSAAFPGLGLPDVQDLLGRRKIDLLPRELKEHFRLLHNEEVVAESLRRVLASDFEYGLITAYVVDTHARHDSWLQRRVVAFADAGAKHARDVLDRKVRAAMTSARKGTTPAMLAGPTADEIVEKLDAELKRLDLEAREARAGVQKYETKLRLLGLTRAELGRRRGDMVRCKAQIQGEAPGVPVTPADREAWTERFYAALSGPEASAPKRLAAPGHHRLGHLDALRLGELEAVCASFLDAAERGATTILHEMHLPPESKTIRPCFAKGADGRADAGGRGAWGGKVLKFEAWNVRYEVATDDHGVFNGSDECAAKAAGHHRNGCREYLREALEVKGLRVPLSATVDYHGFRVLAVAKLPLVQTTFGEDGQVRREREELVHGTADRGETVLNTNRALDHLLENVGSKLNLAKHAVKGSKDLNAKELHASVDARGFRMKDGTFGLVNLWRALPAENPAETPHLADCARGHSIFWRMLRPEYLRRLPEPLSPDADCAATCSTTDGDEHVQRARRATKRLVTTEVADLAETLAARGPLGPPPAEDAEPAFDPAADPFFAEYTDGVAI